MDKEKDKSNLFIGLQDFKKLNPLTIIDFKEYFKNFSKNDKIEAVTAVKNEIILKLKENNSNSFLNEGVYYFHRMCFRDRQSVEIFAKTLFNFLYKRINNLNGESYKNVNPLYIALDFENQDYAKEFIRIFSIFYIKSGQNGKESKADKTDEQKAFPYMEKVQIAVCSTNEKTQLKQVNFVLAGDTLTNAYATAKNYVYYNVDASLDFVPLLSFLSTGEKVDSNFEPLFPFDLYLHESKEQNWFKSQMEQRITTDLRLQEYGCKIPDVKVRLGSKIYINTFYEAELLFHNVGTIKRFAYLLANEILNDDKQNIFDSQSYLFLLGYENYSAVLMQEVHYLLQNYLDELENKKFKLEWVIDTRSEDFPVLSFDKYSFSEREKIIQEKTVYCITIIPLGSTMSTVYKLHNSFERGIKRIKKEINSESIPEVKFLGNYCLVAIGDVFKELSDNEVASKYLKLDNQKKQEQDNQGIKVIKSKSFDNQNAWQTVILQKQKLEDQGIEVKYLLRAPAKWKMEDEDKDKPLMKVDKTSTLLDAYFQTPLKPELIEYYKRKSRVDKLVPKDDKSFVKYGHILRGDNHYQFYFDFEKITESKKNEIKKWANDEKAHIDKEAYNIVISPLQITNASFLNIILEEMFESNLHLLHININATGKENVRTKFEFIAHEFYNIIRKEQKINFYYVDDAVCTGNGLARAWKFLLTLCNQSGVDPQKLFHNDRKFTKVFLLVNRSSYETAQTWVKNPNKDWLGFINLCVPSYNTHMDNNLVTCPGCRIQARYDLLRKRSATNELAAYFSSQAKKHKARNPQEYDLWLDEKIMNSPSYFKWLCVWLWFKEKDSDLLDAINNFYEDKDIAARWNQQNIKTFCEEEQEKQEEQKKQEKQVKVEQKVLLKIKEIIAYDNYLRLKTMDEAYRKLLYNEDLQKLLNLKEFSNYKDKLKEKIVELLANCFDENDYDEEKSYDAVFKFISYLKVISRDYLAKNYFIRETVFIVLKDIFHFMIIEKGYGNIKKFISPFLDKNGKNNWLKIFKSIAKLNKSLQYRIFKVIVHRLALMRCVEMFEEDVIRKTYEVFSNLNDNEDCEKKFLILPTKEEMIISHLASIKTATMEEDNDLMCSVLWDQTESLWKAVKDKEKEKNKEKIIIISLLLENTRILFDFMQELSDRCTNLGDPIDAQWTYKGYVGIGSLEGRKKRIKSLKKEKDNKEWVKHLINQCYNRKKYSKKDKYLYQNSISSFLKFYEKVFGDPKVELNKIVEMLNFFNILRYLTEDIYKEQRHKGFDAFPYIFEDLCLSIRNMTDANSVYLVYKKEGEASQLISRSGYVINNKDTAFPLENEEDRFSPLHIGSVEFDLLIKSHYSKGTLDVGNIEDTLDVDNIEGKLDVGNIEIELKKIIVDGLTNIEETQKYGHNDNLETYNHNFLMFDFPFQECETLKEKLKNEEERRHFYIILELSKDESNNKDSVLIKNAIRILFLRNRLWEAVKKYYSGVLNFRFFCNYMRSVNFEDNYDKVKILHLTDLHLEDNDNWDIRSHNFKNLIQKLNTFKNKIDLVAVTGDIVNAFDNAAVAQRKYKRAANLLFEMAKSLWGIKNNDSIILPHDWKRRIIITTGNHDYVTMGDVQVQTESRKIAVGFPAKSTGGTMSKYTYYLEFLSYFLDAPTQKLLKYDLNEVRQYDYLNLFVGVFNSCSKANALQNNKVSFDAQKVKLVIEDSNWKEEKYNGYRHFIFAHHSPQYSEEIDYFEDKYEYWKLSGTRSFDKLYWAFLTEMGKYLVKKKLIIKKKYLDLLIRKKVDYNKYDFNNLWENVKIKSNELVKSEIIQDMRMLYDIINNQSHKYADEYIEKFLTEARNLFVTMYKDVEQFREVYEFLCAGVDNVVVCAGHTHKAKQNPKNDYSLSYIGHKFYDNDGITFEVINVNNKDVQREIYSFFENSWWQESKDKEKIQTHLNLS